MPFMPARKNLPSGVTYQEGLTVNQAKKLIDAIGEGEDPQIVEAGKRKLGLDDQAITAWKKVQSLPDDDPTRIQVRNKVFDIASQNIPPSQEGGGGADFIDRFAVKNLIDQDPILIQKYFSKKGYDTKHTPDGLLVRKPDSPVFQFVDPEGLDRFDLFDIAGDTLEGALVGLATGATAAAVVPTGGASLAWIPTVGATSAGLFEAGKQGVANILDMRDDYDPGRITQSAIIGGVTPVIAKGAGVALKKGGELLGRGMGKLYPLRPDAEEVIAAGKRLGVKPKLRQLFDSDTVKNLEQSLERVPGTLGGMRTRKASKAFNEGMDRAADSIFGSYKSLDVADVGDKFKSQMIKAVKEELKPAEQLYDQIEEQFKRGAYKNISKSRFKQTIDDLMDKYEFDDKAVGALKKVSKKFDRANSLNKIKDLRTVVGKDIGVFRKKGESVAEKALGEAYQGLTNVRSDTLKKLVENSQASPEFVAETLDKIKAADTIYKNTAEAVKNALVKRGQNLRGGVIRTAEKFDDVVADGDVVRKVLNINDPKKIEKFARDFPNEFELLRMGKISDLVNKSSTRDIVNAKSFIKKIDAMPRKTKALLMGDDALQKIDDLKTLFNSLPPDVNPSGTSYNLEFMKMLAAQWGAMARSARLKIITNPQLQRDFMSKIGRFLGTDLATGAAQFGARTSIDKPVSDQQRMERSILPIEEFVPIENQRTILPPRR